MLRISKMADVSILHLYGEVSLLEMEMMEKIFQSLHRHRHTKVLVDLAEVEHLHYRVFRQWILAAEKFRTNQGDLKLANAGRTASLLLRFTGADQYLADYSSLSDAMLSFLGSPRTASVAEGGKGGGMACAASENLKADWETVLH